MKVIEEKKPLQEQWSIQASCSSSGNGNKGCGSLLEVEHDDLRYFAEQEYPWRIQPAAVCFKCPICGEVTDLLKNQWPPFVSRLSKWTIEWHNAKLLDNGIIDHN